jgi:hypothetical protein
LASIVNGVRELVMSSIENLFAPPLAVSLMVICQSLLGKDAELDWSSNLMRRLSSFSRIVSNPKASPSTQEVPTHS